jgi:two-component system nitrogen regulation response regulator NtrX
VTSAPTTSITAPTVLVVDDDDDTRAAISELLEEQGYRVATARNGRDAEQYLLHRPAPACMVLDLWMPVMDGWTLAAEIDAGRLPRVPFVVVTAAAPYWGYPKPPGLVLTKPASPARLLALVDQAVRGKA